MFFPYSLFDPTMLVLIPSILLAMYAQTKIKTTFNKYLRVQSKKGYTGYQVARALLDNNRLSAVHVEITRGHLSDHYDPRKKVVRLSNEVYHGKSIASISVAAHETGHAIQHANGYVPLNIRSALFPVASFGSKFSWFFIIIGIGISATTLIDVGILLFGAAVLFQVATLPVEFNASSKAIKLLDANGFIVRDEYKSSQKVLKAAALTYVAATASAISQLIRLILIRDSRKK